jgi:hypothetical protein
MTNNMSDAILTALAHHVADTCWPVGGINRANGAYGVRTLARTYLALEDERAGLDYPELSVSDDRLEDVARAMTWWLGYMPDDTQVRLLATV